MEVEERFSDSQKDSECKKMICNSDDYVSPPFNLYWPRSYN